ncbi:MAG: hypothetical protein WD805_05590 [Gaiellaceae bacterium]
MVNRNGFRETEANDFLALDPELLRQLFRRQVIRHTLSFPRP